jgi:Holliday junction DNA helicase RuvA
MLSFLRGKILNKGSGYIIVETNNVGYQVFVNAMLYADFDVGQAVEIYTHQYVREDALDLYGFKSLEELEMFELLLSISGIGPKSALGVLSVASVADIKESISRGDSSLLTKVSGIGRKTAERVVLELREKIVETADARTQTAGGSSSVRGEEIDALMALGYSMQQARDALRGVDAEIKDSGERIKAALKRLSK